jgi:hypothetical protein
MLLVVVLVPQTVYADDAPAPGDPPEARIRPPGGVISQARIKSPTGEPTTDARIHPPGGAPHEDARIKPPIGVTSPEPSLFEQLIDWLVLQARIRPPIG